jgi:hypothetical protein
MGAHRRARFCWYVWRVRSFSKARGRGAGRSRLGAGARAALLFLGLSTAACGAAPAGRAVDPVPSVPIAASPPVATAKPPEDDGGAIDLSITFHPGFSDHLGWVKLPRPLSFRYLGNPGATIQRFDGAWERIKGDAIAQKVFELELENVDWDKTAVLLDEGRLCSRELEEAVARKSPSRLLLRIDGGITKDGVRCLARLSAPRIHLAGCLYRSHRAEDRCDGDAEIEALAEDDRVRARVGGLALSVSRGESLARLSRFPELTYLALVAGRAPAIDLRFGALPFEGLSALRYLDISNWEVDQRVWGHPLEKHFLAQLHTLRWQGELSSPLGECQLRRLSVGRLTTEQVKALASCTRLTELSSDGAELDAMELLAPFSQLENLHLRHAQALDLSPLAKLTRLRELSLTAGKGEGFGFVRALPELRVVDLSQSTLSDLTPFADLSHLETLDVDFTQVADLGPIAGRSTLTELELHQTKVVDLGPLTGLRALTKLSVSETAVSDLSPLRGHPALSWVILRESKVHDASALLTMPSLTRAHIGGLSLPAAQLAALKERLGYSLDGAR